MNYEYAPAFLAYRTAPLKISAVHVPRSSSALLVTPTSNPALATKGRTIKAAKSILIIGRPSNLTLVVTPTSKPALATKGRTMKAAMIIPTTGPSSNLALLVTTISDPALATKGRIMKAVEDIPIIDYPSYLTLVVTTISDPAMAKGRITPLTLRNVRTFATLDHPSNLALLATRAPYQQKLIKLLTLPRGSIPIGGRNSSLRLKRHLPRRHRLLAKSLQRRLHLNLRRSAIFRKSLCPPSVDPRNEILTLVTTHRSLNGSLI